MPTSKLRPCLSKKEFKERYGQELITARGKQARRLSALELKTTFGISPLPKLRPRQKKRAKEADDLFSDMYRIYGIASLNIFREAAVGLHDATLHKMSECPEFVLAYMRRQLEPARVEALREKTVKKLRSKAEQIESELRRLT